MPYASARAPCVRKAKLLLSALSKHYNVHVMNCRSNLENSPDIITCELDYH